MTKEIQIILKETKYQRSVRNGFILKVAFEVESRLLCSLIKGFYFTSDVKNKPFLKRMLPKTIISKQLNLNYSLKKRTGFFKISMVY